jgi:hypothetical protein
MDTMTNETKVDAAQERLRAAHRAVSDHMRGCSVQGTACDECERASQALEGAREAAEKAWEG